MLRCFIFAVPRAVQNLDITAISGSAIVASWEPSDNPNGVITEYNVTYSRTVATDQNVRKLQYTKLQLILKSIIKNVSIVKILCRFV